jgi:hypothetical protein
MRTPTAVLNILSILCFMGTSLSLFGFFLIFSLGESLGNLSNRKNENCHLKGF